MKKNAVWLVLEKGCKTPLVAISVVGLRLFRNDDCCCVGSNVPT